MHIKNFFRWVIFPCAILSLIILSLTLIEHYNTLETIETSQTSDYIKYAEFNPNYALLNKALKYDLSTYEQNIHLDWIELLSYCAAKNDGKFTKSSAKEMDNLASKLLCGEDIHKLTKNLKDYNYYHTVYSAVLDEFIGEYTVEVYDELSKNEKSLVTKYGLKTFSPIAKGYSFSHYDDFNAANTYGFEKTHLGNDLQGTVGTPIIAVEGGTVEDIGWNEYGGWQIGIRSFDKKRYYYYGHLQDNHPYIKNLSVGSNVQSGDVIGYLGMSGHDNYENVKNVNTPHLHFGLQLIFDESQKGSNEIWIDVYSIIELLSKNKSEVTKDEETGEYRRRYNIIDEFQSDTVSTSENAVPVPIIMYHSILKDSSRSGKYVVTPKTLENDMKYLKDNGYETITMSRLIDYVKNKTPLPEKPIILTFDDGYLNNQTYLLPLLEKYDMNAVISVVGEYVDKFSKNQDTSPNYAHLTWNDLIALVESGRVEIQNHSYNMHSLSERRGSMKKTTETISQYREIFIEDTMRNQDALLENCGIEPNTYTYPYGHITKESVEFLKELGFDAALTCYEYINYIDDNEDNLMKLGRFNRASGISTETFMSRILPK